MADHSAWAEKELSALISIGVNPIDAQRTVTWVLEHLPPGADPATWVPKASDLNEPINDNIIQDALIVWIMLSAVRYKKLLSASGSSSLYLLASNGEHLPSYIWDTEISRYIVNGRLVPREAINDLMRQHGQATEDRLHDIATAFHEKRITPASFTEQVATEQRRSMLQNISLAKGGLDQLTIADYAYIAGLLLSAFGAVVGTAQDVLDGAVTLPQLLNRTDGYYGITLTAYYDTQRKNVKVSDQDKVMIARRLLDPSAQHCPQCPIHYQAGWVLASNVVPPGSQCQCQSHCRCGVIQREVLRSELSNWLGTKR